MIKILCWSFRREKVLVVQGTGFNWKDTDHLRFVFLPHEEQLRDAIERFARYLAFYRERAQVAA